MKETRDEAADGDVMSACNCHRPDRNCAVCQNGGMPTYPTGHPWPPIGIPYPRYEWIFIDTSDGGWVLKPANSQMGM